MSLRMIFAASLLTGLWLGAARADDAPKGPPPPPHGPGFSPPGWGPPGPRMMPLMDADADNDGRITRAEIDRAIETRFAKADADNSGALDQKEFATAMRPPKPPADAPKPPEGMPRHPPFDPAARFKATDWNGDGKLTRDEYSVPFRAMAIHADRDGDGVVAMDELPPRGPRPPH